MLVNKKVSPQILTDPKDKNNIHKMKQITLYQPMCATRVWRNSADFVPVDKNIAGFTTPEEAEKMLAIAQAKDPLGTYKVIAINYQYAESYQQYSMFRNNAGDIQHSSFNKGSIEDIKNGLFIAQNSVGSYVGTYSSRKLAEQACRNNGCHKGEENVIERKVFQTFAGYQRYLAAIKRNSTSETTR